MTEKKKENNLVYMLLALIVMLLWGSLYPTGKLSYAECNVDTNFYPNLLLFAGTRFTISGTLICLFQGVRTKSIPKVDGKKEWLGVALVALFACFWNYTCTYLGLSMVESSKTALLKQSGILVFIFFSFLILKEEKFSVGKAVGALLGLVSIVVLNSGDVGFSLGLGETLVVLSSFGTGISSVVIKKLLKRANAITVTGYSQLFGGIALLLIGLCMGGTFYFDEAGDYLLFGYILLATCISYVLWYTILQKMELSKMFIVKLSEPMFAAVISAIILQENLLKIEYLIAFLCVGCALVVSNLNVKSLFQSKKKATENAGQERGELINEGTKSVEQEAGEP